jgi:DnaK suppressor protein
MAAKKSAPKPSKVKKPAMVKPVPKKAAPAAKKPVAKTPAAEPVKRPTTKAAAVPAKKVVPPPPAPPVAAAVRHVAPRVAANDGDDSDINDSLLAGPRNVQPYVPKRGEQYMNKEQLEHFRKILLSWKQDLMLEVDRTVSHMKDEAANFPDPNDRATQEEEFSLELRTRDRERKLIRKIDEAIGRIEDGSYGYCLETGEQIGVKRLEARPVATLSIEAQERRERREKQYGDRDDRYR